MNVNESIAALRPDWKALVAQYQQPRLGRSIWEIINSYVPLLALFVLMYFSTTVSYWLTLALVVPTAAFLMRVFIILHDCGHASFFKSVKANDWVGLVCGVFTFTPYLQWRRAHAIHHATAGDLDRRGIGDVLTLTVAEYQKLPWWRKVGYRAYRNPFVTFAIGPLFVFFLRHRWFDKSAGKRERWSVWFTNLALLAAFLVLGYFLGFGRVLFIHLLVMGLGSVAGVWMFYVQHQFEDTYWEHHPDWEYLAASLKGSSYYRLPKVLQWVTGNIGFHHIHHLAPKIPNYNLPRAYAENPLFHHVTVVTFWESVRCVSLKLWDEQSGRMVGWRHLKTLNAAQ